MAYTPNAYYSGAALEGINRGRTADAEVEARDNASQRSFLASMADNRTRRDLGNRELGIRESIGNADLGLRRDLGTGELGLRRFLGVGALDNAAEANATTRGLGIAELQSKAELAQLAAKTALAQIQGQIAQVELQGKQLIDYARAGGGMNPQVQREMMRNDQQMRELKARAESASAVANADLQTLISNLDPPNWSWENSGTMRLWKDTPEMRQEYFNTNPDVRSATVGSVLRGLGTEADVLSYDPATRQFMPSRTLFPGGSVATPGINPTLPSPVMPSQPRSLWERFNSSRR
jgi:hypothetical protein